MKEECKIKQKYIIVYSLLITFTSLVAYSYLIFNGYITMRRCDGQNQYYYSLIYYGKYLREILNNIFVHHQFSLPMWDMTIGYGSDILTTLHYYAIGDPLNLLAVFFDETNTSILFCLLIYIRIYLAGLLFSLFSLSHGNESKATLLGALVYCFCGWTTIIGIQYVAFSNPLIYFPLLLLGVDKIYKKKNPLLFIFGIVLSAVSNFYFFYMLCIFVFLYIVFQYFNKIHKFEIKSIVSWAGKFLLYAVIGVCMSAIILLPVIQVLFNGERIGTSYYVPFLYQPIYYVSLIRDSMSPLSNIGSVSIGGISLLLIVFSKGHKNYKLAILLFGVILCVPFFSHVINGFAYVSDRWTWSFVMLVSMIVVKIFPSFFTQKKFVKIMLSLILCMTIGLDLFLSDYFFAPIFSIIYFMLIIFIAPSFIKNKKILENLLFIGVIVSIGINSYSVYADGSSASGFSNYVKQKNVLAFEETALAKLSENESFESDQYRIYLDNPYEFEEMNVAMLFGVNGTEAYFSLMDGVVPQFYNELYVKAVNDFKYEGMDNRIILNSLLSIKYIIADSNMVGTGYELKNKIDDKHSLYENKNVLPIGYTYDTYISKSNWDKMSPEMKEISMLQGIVLKDSQISKELFSQADIEATSENVEYSFNYDDEIKIIDNKITVLKKGAVLKLQFPDISEKELYIKFEGFDFSGKATTFDININDNNSKKMFTFYTKKHSTYSGRDSFIINTGYKKDKISEICITFNEEGIYSFSDLVLLTQNSENISRYVKDLSEEYLDNLKVETNSISGTINLKKDKYLCMSIPYSKGWSVYVDGKKEKVLRANSMMMAVELEPGYHEIRFKYVTPYLKEGIIISLIGALWCIIVIWKYKKND